MGKDMFLGTEEIEYTCDKHGDICIVVKNLTLDTDENGYVVDYDLVKVVAGDVETGEEIVLPLDAFDDESLDSMNDVIIDQTVNEYQKRHGYRL